jgi:hypothetical protein
MTQRSPLWALVLPCILAARASAATVTAFPCIGQNPTYAGDWGPGTTHDDWGSKTYVNPPAIPAGWLLNPSPNNGTVNAGSNHQGPAVLSNAGAYRIRMSCERALGTRVNPDGNAKLGYFPLVYTAGNPSATEATVMQYKYDLTNFPGDEIALGACFKVRGVASDLNEGETVISVSLPGGPGIAIQVGKSGNGHQALFGVNSDYGFHLYQFRQSTGELTQNMDRIGGTNPKVNLSGPTRKLFDLMVLGDGQPGNDISNPSGIVPNWNTEANGSAGYHVFWLYVNRNTRRVMARMDSLDTVILTLSPLNFAFNHVQNPVPPGPSGTTCDPAVYGGLLPADWDATGYAQFGSRDWDVHSEDHQWAPNPAAGSPLCYFLWSGDFNDHSGEYYPQSYGSADNRIFYGAAPNTNGVLGGNAVVLTTTWADTPFANCITPPQNCMTLTSVSPTQGEIGTVVPVTVRGANFVPGQTTVLFQSGQTKLKVAPAAVSVAADGNSATCNIDLSSAPAGQTTLWDVYVYTPCCPWGILAQAFASTCIVNPPPCPTLTAISPAKGTIGSVLPVTVTGANFVAGHTSFTLTLNPVTDPPVTMAVSPSRVTVAPDGASCTFNLNLTSPPVPAGVSSQWDLTAAVDCCPGVTQPALFTTTPCNIPFADSNADGLVNMMDFALLQRCYRVDATSSFASIPGISCACFDRNGDELVDMADVDEFQKCVTGPVLPWSQALAPDCRP